jgi:hypothetical protein
VRAIALGHARLSNTLTGERPTVNREIHEACVSMMRTDQRMFIRQLFRLTGGEDTLGGYGEDLVDRYLQRVPMSLEEAFWETRAFEGERIGERLSQLDMPMLFAQHKGCLLFTDEGYQDAIAAFPDTTALTCEEKPSTDIEFARALREFCAEVTKVPG